MSKPLNPDGQLVVAQSLRWILQLAALTTAITFAVELCIMLLMPYILPKGATELQEALFDATLLAIGIALLVVPLMLAYRKKALRKLRRAVQLQAVLDLHASVSVSTDADAITYVNDEFCQLSGYNRSELLGQSYALLSSGVHPPEFFEDLDRTIRSGAIWRGEICNRRKDGSLVWVRATIAPFVGSGAGAVEYFSVRTDITEQKALETQTLRHRDQVKSILDNMGEAVYTLNDQGHLTYMNAQATSLLGWQMAEVNGRAFQSLIQSVRAPDALVAKDGLEFKVKLNTSPLWLQGENTGTIVVFSDARVEHEIQQRLVEAKDAAEANVRQKGQFLATMSHEIRTPLNGVVGMADLLLDTTLNPDQTEIARTIQLSADALMAVINDVLDYSKIEAGQMDLEKTEFSLRTVAEGAVDLLAGKAHDKGLTLACHIDPELADGFVGDPSRIRQILLNFLSNAVKFTRRGEVLLSVTAAPKSAAAEVEGAAWIELSVKDSGVGVADDVKDRLFQPFTQADSTTTREFGGTGLGLSICRRLAEAMNGSAGMQSQLGNGSIFWVRVPLVLAAIQTAHAADARVLRGKQVLIGGDTAGCHAILGQSFSAWGMRHSTFETLSELLYLLDHIKSNGMPAPDLLLLGPSFPDASLLSSVTQLRDLGHEAIICCLAHRENSQTKGALAALGAVVMQKPIKQSILLDCLMNAFFPQGNESTFARSGTFAAYPARAPKALNKTGGELLAARGKRLLLAEDNEINQRIALRMLARLGFEADVVSDGQQALNAALTGEYAVILMDCQMPILDGYAATRHIRREVHDHWPGGDESLRIIAMTANAMHGDKELCLAAGMDDYLSKPIDMRALGDVLARWLTPTETAMPRDKLRVEIPLK